MIQDARDPATTASHATETPAARQVAQAIEFLGHAVPAGFERGFLDPCHGGLFSLDGQHLAGPGQRGLDRFPLRYLPDGTVAADLTELQATSGAAG